jgi:hypothetical protein
MRDLSHLTKQQREGVEKYLTDSIKGYKRSIKEMNASLQEIEVIRNSPVLFGYGEMDLSKDINSLLNGGRVEYNPITKAEEIFMNMGNRRIRDSVETYFSIVGHELRHLYQFSQGELASAYYIKEDNWGSSGLYDYYDEYDAFYITHSLGYRGGDLEKKVLSSVDRFPYNTLPKMRINLSTSSYEAFHFKTGRYHEPNKGKTYEQLMREGNEKSMKEGNYLKYRFLGDGYW